MRRKSKFIAFLLSFIPGLSHFYLGYAERGTIYLVLTGAGSGGSLALAFLSSSEFFIFTMFAAYAVLWLIALIDAFNLINKLRYGAENISMLNELGSEETRLMNKKIITLGLSMIPGAGHMYLGQQKKGLVYMGMFFFTVFFMGWLNLSFLLFLIPLIWFYAFFDAFHIVNGSEVEDIDVDILNLLPKINHEYIGKGLIGLGVLIVFQRIFFPMVSIYLDYRIRNYIQTSLVAFIFISLGLKMLKKKKEVELEDEEDED